MTKALRVFNLALALAVGGGVAACGAEEQSEQTASSFGSLTQALTQLTLTVDQSIYSEDGRFELIMQADGNLVLYHRGVGPLWASNTEGTPADRAVMQSDGNLVVYAGDNPLWASNTHGNAGSSLEIQNDGNLVIYTSAGLPIWATDTCCVPETQTAPETETVSWVLLKSMFQGENMCLESNDPVDGDNGGNAFMTSCGNFTGQLWQLVPDGDWYRLKSMFQGENMCLESNDPSESEHGGNAFMVACDDVSGQLWNLVPNGDWYLLKSQFQGEDMCLESNDPIDGDHDGNAFMTPCGNFSGQHWQFEESQ